MNTRWFLAAMVAMSLLPAHLPSAGVRDPRSMPSATSSARPLFANPTNPQSALAAAEWTAVTAPLPPIQNIAAIAASTYHTCALTIAGGVKCWGANGSGQLGDGTTTQRSTPVDVAGLGGGVVAIAVGGGHTCAITTVGGVKCWGNNYYGQLGDGTTTDRSTPVDVAELESGVAAVVADGFHTCALTTAGGVKCWGRNNYGQLGDGTTTDRSTPMDVVGLGSGAVTIAAGESHTCAVSTAGGVKCWGLNQSGQLGDGTTTNRLTPVDVVGLASGVTAIAAGGYHTCAVLTVGGVKCWGGNWLGQLGDGTTTDRSTPVGVTGLGTGAAAIAAGDQHTCALTAAGGVKCWGWNVYGQLGDGTTTDRNTPVDVAGLGSGATAIAVGSVHVCALTAAGGAKCWGWNGAGQLGDGATFQRSTPVDVAGLGSGMVAITAGGAHSCALLTAGGVKCWGRNGSGQLGDGTRTDRSAPVDVVGLAAAVAASGAGLSHTCALTTAGGVKCWGANWAGQLGDGTTTPRSMPVDVVGLGSGAVAIATGYAHTCVVTTAGGVKCWGENFHGQLGDGTTTERWTPVDVMELATGAAAIAAGGSHTCALLTAGGVKCWGRNLWGQLGDGTTTSRGNPVDVVGLGTGVAAIVSGYSHTCALTTTGGVKCWGNNVAGQVGDGTLTAQNTPVDVMGLGSGVSAIAAGGSHTCAVTTAGGVKCWGDNERGQLGDGTTTNRSTPVDVVGLGSGAAAIAAGGFHTCTLVTAGGVKCWGWDIDGQLGLGTTLFSTTPVDVVTLLQFYLPVVLRR